MGQKKKYSQDEVDQLFKQLDNTTPEELVKKVRERGGEVSEPDQEKKESSD